MSLVLNHRVVIYSPFLTQGCQLFPFSITGLSFIPLFYHRAVIYSPFLSQGCHLLPFSITGLSFTPLFYHRAVSYTPFLSQGCQLFLFFYHRALIYSSFLSPFFLFVSSCFCVLLGHSPDFCFLQKILQHFSLRDIFFVQFCLALVEQLGDGRW